MSYNKTDKPETMTEKKTAEEVYEILTRLVLADDLSTTWKIKCHKSTTKIMEIMESYAAQQSKMPTREECDKKMFEILSQPTSLGKDLRGVRSPAMMMAEYSEWLRNQINK